MQATLFLMGIERLVHLLEPLAKAEEKGRKPCDSRPPATMAYAPTSKRLKRLT